MADYSWVKDQSGSICGIWLKDPSNIQKRGYVETLLVLNCQHLLGPYLRKMYRTVPNKVNSEGGCFVMFGSAKAPGE